MNYNHDMDIARTIGDKAFSRMVTDNLPPQPAFYELWYAYFANFHKELRRIIDARLTTGQTLSALECANLYDEFLSPRKNQEIVTRAGNQINETLHDVSSLIGNVKTIAARYSETLTTATERILAVETPEQMQSVVQSIVADTNIMVENNAALERELEKTAKAMDDLRKDLEFIRREALTDGLTGLSNRKAFDERLSILIDQAASEKRTFTLLMVDIDHFKSFNDNFGHQVGDQVLRLVARTLTDGVKGKDITARYGGEEFAILLPDTSLAHGLMVAESLRKVLASKEVINRATGDNLGRITMSTGAAEFYAGESAESMIGRADAALYTAKHNGRNQVAAAPTPFGNA